MKKILVTGATGGLGQNAVKFLLNKSFEVVALGRNENVLSSLRQAGAHVHSVDIAKASVESLVQVMSGCDTVWHCAALAAPWGPYPKFYDTNVVGSEKLYAAAQQVGCRNFINVSSPSIYFDYSARTEIPESFLPAEMVNYYAKTKWLAEERLSQLNKADHMRLVHLRPRAIFGPHDNVLLPRLLTLVKSHGGMLPLPNGGTAVLDLTYVDNVVHALMCATITAAPKGRAFNITNDEPVQIQDALTTLLNAIGQPVQIKPVPYAALDIAARLAERFSVITRKEPALTRYGIGALAYDMTLDITRAKQEIGYKPLISMAEAIERTAAWFKTHG